MKGSVPPLLKADDTVPIGINLGEELIELRIWHSKSSARKGGLELALVQLAILIPVDAFEEIPQLFLRLFDKDSELFKRGSQRRACQRRV